MSHNKKYELLKNDTINHLGKTLYRIRRISTGELGGYIEKESNLSHYKNAWVYGSARVSGNACVYDNAWVYGNACVYGNALVSGNARVSGDTLVSGNACVYGNARVSGNAWVRNFDEITTKENIINIIGYKHSITITPTSVNIGCMSFTFDQLNTFNCYEDYSEEEIEEIKQLVSIGINKIMRDI